MYPTLIRRAQFGTQHEGHHGMQPWRQAQSYDTYKSKYGPDYKIARNFHGLTPGRMIKFGATAGGFGAVAGVFALFFFAQVPKVRDDILGKLPIIGDYFHVEIPPEDNPF